MAKNNDITTLSETEVAEIVEKECRKRLNMSTKEFLQKRERGELPRSTAVHDIEILLKLA